MKTFTRSAIATAVVLMTASASAQYALPTEAAANSVALKQINAYSAWSRGYTGMGVRLAVVDTGADLKNVDLSNVILSKSPYQSTITDASRGHGTQMISIIAGAKNNRGMIGVAYDAKVLAYAGGSSGMLSTSNVYNGILWAADNAATAINLSVGFSMSKPSFATNYYTTNPSSGVYIRKPIVAIDSYANSTFVPALQYATSKGSITVIAAGNDGNPVPVSPANSVVRTDASGKLIMGGRAIVVGAVDSKNVIAPFSNRAGHICQTVVSGMCTDKVQIKDYFLVAPGGSLVWAANANNPATPIAQLLGTSPATAFVTGGIGVIKQAWPTLRPEQIVQVLLKTATDLGAPGVDVVYGNGLMNLDAATRPLGSLTLAKITSVSSTQIAAGPTPLSMSRLSSGVLGKQSLANSSVLQSAQVVDSVGRNFTVNMSAGVDNSLQNYDTATSYSVLSNGQINRVNIGNDTLVNSIYTSPNMSGAVLGKKFGDSYVGMELGTANETNGMLGSAGTGALALGNSKTNWTSLHLGYDVNNVNVFGSVAHGSTTAFGKQDSLITGFSTIATRSFTLGARQTSVFAENDSLSFQVSVLPYITNGAANVTAVTGFKTSDVTDEGATSTPVVASEKVNLVSNYRQYAATMSYERKLSKSSNLNLVASLQSDNSSVSVKPGINVTYAMQF